MFSSQVSDSRQWQDKIIAATFNNLRQEEHQGFMEILANEKPQKSRVTVFFDDKKQP